MPDVRQDWPSVQNMMTMQGQSPANPIAQAIQTNGNQKENDAIANVKIQRDRISKMLSAAAQGPQQANFGDFSGNLLDAVTDRTYGKGLNAGMEASRQQRVGEQDKQLAQAQTELGVHEAEAQQQTQDMQAVDNAVKSVTGDDPQAYQRVMQSLHEDPDMIGQHNAVGKAMQHAAMVGVDPNKIKLAQQEQLLNLQDKFNQRQEARQFGHQLTLEGLKQKAEAAQAVQKRKQGYSSISVDYANFGDRLKRADETIKPLEKAVDPKETYMAVSGGLAGNALASPEAQQYAQGAQEWIRAKLRKESGAAIGVDEMKQDYKNYFPMPGDSKNVIEQKKKARESVGENFIKSSGGAYEDFYGNNAQPQSAPQISSPDFRVAVNKQTGQRIKVYNDGRTEQM